MNRKKTALSVAAAGTATGVVGLVLIASPAGANEPPPALPGISAEALVESVLSKDHIPALSGAVEFQQNIGLPIPGLPASSAEGDAIAHVYANGDGAGRISIDQGQSERTVVHNNGTTWVWNSANRSVTKYANTDSDTEDKGTPEQLADPAGTAREVVGLMQRDSTLTVDGTARVAGRPVYQLVLTPKPTERTLLREIRVSVDSETRLPLRLDVLANGQADPAVRVGFTEFKPGPQDPALFTFTPPAGAKVTDGKDAKTHGFDEKNVESLLGGLDFKTVGEGWDTVLTGKFPAQLLSQGLPTGNGRGGETPGALIKQFAKEVTGPFGTGYAISTHVGTALITTDGRIAVGAVPQQVLVDALGQK
ncbi:sigma-E factor regulatory protein RseB domain-containing protein [Actinokineospora auranticolor]|uniref:MucB/RseB family protein n=1 Tax=Actinokineospora auranticolor TaxID=155976 RepID=A0A2S6GYD5_9PSEU|nr:sigma-E factor regulatory protein RseB domain-containing protein [Actinokineospora auranticolor]PPK70187.1 MucB/RseB family protein [Actinokineospora auranticolor]